MNLEALPAIAENAWRTAEKLETIQGHPCFQKRNKEHVGNDRGAVTLMSTLAKILEQITKPNAFGGLRRNGVFSCSP